MRDDETFRRNTWPTLGVELELQLVDARTMALKSVIEPILSDIPFCVRESVKPEFMQCYIEINSDVCHSVEEVDADLNLKIRAVEQTAAHHDTRLFWAATHPFSCWRDQQITPNDRYYKLADLLRETVVRPVTFGLHVHVGVESGEQAIAIGERLKRYLPLLLALSANSPFWHGRFTGHHSHRIEVLESFPTGGLPPTLHSWDEYLALVHQLKTGGFIETTHDIWWDLRPNAENGTLEVRICDMPPSLPDVLNLTALIQCLVNYLASQDDRGTPEPEIHPLIVKQNRWRACRYGLDAELVDPVTWEHVPARRALERLEPLLRSSARALGCQPHLDALLETAFDKNGSLHQLTVFEQTGDLAEMVRRLTARSALYQPGSEHNLVYGYATANGSNSV